MSENSSYDSIRRETNIKIDPTITRLKLSSVNLTDYGNFSTCNLHSELALSL